MLAKKICWKYRYGFNGKEGDGGGEFGGTHYDYGFRIYNPSIGRFLSVDPLTASFAYYSPYQFAGNKPIMFIDLDGAEFQIPTFEKFKYGDNQAVNVITVADNAVINTVNGGIGLVNSGIYTIHKLFANPTAIPSELKSESQALISETGKYLEGQYSYITRTPIKQQLIDAGEDFKNPESYEAPLELASGLLLAKTIKLPQPKYVSSFIPLNKLKINSSGISKVREHLSKMDPDVANDVMIDRLEKISSGKLKATSQDLNFYAHELREGDLMSKGFSYDEAHKQSLKDYGIEYKQGYESHYILKTQ